MPTTNQPDEKAHPEKLDEKDRTILDELSRNSRLSEQKLAKKTGIPMTTVHNRISKLRAHGIIERYTVRLNYTKLGAPMTAFILVKAINAADQHELLEKIKHLPHVYEGAMITGDFDLMFKARVASMDELNHTVVQGLRKIKNVGESRTMLCYETFEK